MGEISNGVLTRISTPFFDEWLLPQLRSWSIHGAFRKCGALGC